MSEHRGHDRGSATGRTDRPTVEQSLLPTTSLPFHRITAWLAGLAIGGVLLLVLGVPLPSSATRSTTAYSADGVGGETVTGLSEDGAADAARELSAAEATNRLDQLRATRGTRGETTAVWVNPVPGAPYTAASACVGARCIRVST